MLNFALGLVFLSGCTGLIYQVTWQKYLSTLVGSHASAAAAILALFFLFLSLGYSLFGRFASRFMRNQMALYGLIELGIGLYALYSPGLFNFIFETYVGANMGQHGAGDADLFSALVLCAAFIAIPTTLMGGTLPVLTQALSSSYEVSSRRHALIYGINTLGAVVGCVLGGFYLIEAYGLDRTLLIAGDINIFVALSAFAIIGVTKQEFAGPQLKLGQGAPAQTAARVSDGQALTWVLFLISFASGYYTFSLEKLIIRMAGLSLGSTTYTYTIIVGAFIFAIGLGSLILTLNKRFEDPKYFAAVQMAALLSVMALYFCIPVWPDWFLRIRAIFQSTLMNFDIYWVLVFFAFTCILFLPVGLIGANLPLLFGILRTRDQALSRTVGRLYTVNCLGSAVGAAIGGYLIFKVCDAPQAYRVMVAVLAVATALTIYVLFTGRLRLQILAVLGVISLAFFSAPGWPVSRFVPGLFLTQNFASTTEDLADIRGDRSRAGIKYIYNLYDPNTVASILEYPDKSLVLLVNGKPDAATLGDHTARAMAVLTPMALVPHNVEKAFIIGLGAGLSTSLLTKFQEVQHVDIAEISEGVVHSLPYFSAHNVGLKDRMHKVNIEVGDAYRVLMGKGQYDIIICEPSNPWVAGIDKLFSKEFYQLGASHLADHGVYVQWFPMSGVDDKIFLTILNTFKSVFPYASIFSAQGGAFTLVGAKKPVQIDVEKIKSRFSELQPVYKKFGLKTPASALMNQVASPFAVQALTYKTEDVNSLFAPLLEFKSGRANFAGLGVNFSQLLVGSNPIPLPPDADFEGYFFDNPKLVGFVQPQSIQDALGLVKGVFGLHSTRLVLFAKRHFPNEPLFKEEFDKYKDHFYLLGLGEELEKLPVTEKYPLARLEQILGAFRSLIAVNERTKLSLVANFVDQCVPTDSEGLNQAAQFQNAKKPDSPSVEAPPPNCYREKRIAVATLGKPDDIKKVLKYSSQAPTAEQITEVEKMWAAIKATYRKLGAY